MANLLQILPYSNPSLPKIQSAISPLFPYPRAAPEPGALAHWVFDRGSGAGFEDLVSGQTLTPQAATYSFTSNCVVLNAESGNGLATDIDDSAGLTYSMVFRKTSEQVVIGGTLGNVADGTGGGIHLVSPSTAYYRQRAIPSPNATIVSVSLADIDDGAWVHLSGYFGDLGAGTNGARLSLSGAAPIANTVNADNPSISTRKVAIGNGYYAGQGVGQQVAIAEFIVFSGIPLTSSNAADYYDHAKARMADRGIVIV